MEIVTRTTLVLKKRPNVRNLKNGTFCVYQSEVKLAKLVDEITVRIFSSLNELLFEATFTSKEFLDGLRPWTKANSEGYFRSFTD